MGLETLITDGYTLTDLRSDPYVPRKASEGLSSEDENLTLNFFPNPKRSMLVDRFSLGAQVTIVPINRSPLDFVDQVRGTVIYASTAQIRVEMASLDPREVWPHQPQLWRLDLDFNETNFSRCRTAIMQLQYNPTTMENYSDNSWEYPLEGTHLRHALLRQWSCVAHQGTGEVRPDIGRSIAFSSKNDTSRPSIFAYHPGLLDWARRYSSAGPIKRRGDPVLRLNRVQVRAIALMLLKRVSLIQGVSTLVSGLFVFYFNASF